MGTAGILLAVAMCCGAPEASAQLFLNIGGPGIGNAPAQGSAGIGTANLGIGGPGSATEVHGLNQPRLGSNRGISPPFLKQQTGKALWGSGNSNRTAPESLSFPRDHPSS